MKYVYVFYLVISLFFSETVSAQQRFYTDDGIFVNYGNIFDKLSSIILDNNGTMWVGGDYGISRINDISAVPSSKAWTTYTSEDSLGCGRVLSMASDKNNILWVAGREGLSKFDGKTFTNYHQIDNRNISTFYCVYADRNNKKWFGALGKLLITYDDSIWSLRDDIFGLWINGINCITEDINNKIWLGTAQGNYEQNGNEWIRYSEYDLGIPLGNTKAICIDQNNTKWFMSSSRLFSYNDSTWTEHTNQLPFKSLKCMVIDKKGILWIGSYDGIIRSNGKTFKGITSFGNMQIKDVSSIAVDKNNIKWFCINAGAINFISLDDSDVSVSETAPESFTLISNFPNPFNLSTTISFTLSAPGFTELSVYNMAGQYVRKLLSKNLSAGPHTALWNGCDESGKTVSSGVYFSVLKSGGKTATGKMALVK